MRFIDKAKEFLDKEIKIKSIDGKVESGILKEIGENFIKIIALGGQVRIYNINSVIYLAKD